MLINIFRVYSNCSASVKMEKKPLLHIDKCKIRKHWGKTDSEVEEDIETLKKWIKTMDFPEMPSKYLIIS